MAGRIAVFIYGVASYLVTLAAFVYAMGFLGNYGVSKSIDSGAQSPFVPALAINLTLLGVFALQHSIMARQWFKAAWTRIVPMPAERATYCLFSCAALFLLIWKWEPMGGLVWNVENRYARLALTGLYIAGWLTVLAASFLINHFDLFGLRQVWIHLRGREYSPLKFRTPGFYRYVRHPLYVGWFMVFWASPVMTASHLIFAFATTSYILLAIQFEERDMLRIHKEYAEYRRRVPMILPFVSSEQGEGAEVAGRLAKPVNQ